MPKRKKRNFSFAILLQLIISVLYGAMLIHMTVILTRQKTPGWFIYVLVYFPQLVVIISSLVFLFILRLRHRTHSIDTTLLPLLFSFIALEATMILPLYSEVSGITIFAPNSIVIIERFAMLSAAVVFVFASIQYYGTNVSRLRLFLSISIAAACFIALAAPMNTGAGAGEFTAFSSSYDAYLMVMLICLYAASIITYTAAVIKDRATHSASRAFAFILLMIGNFLSTSTVALPSVLSAVIYLAGIIMLTVSAKNTF